METVNRAAFIVKPREPYLRWAASLDNEAARDAESLRARASVYLVPEDPSFKEETPPLREYFDEIFTMELAAWSEDENCWPVNRDLGTLLQWFKVYRQSVVVDLGANELRIEEP